MIFFWIKESFKLIGRAKSSFVLSLISMIIAVFLIVTSAALIKVSAELQSSIKRNVDINVFLDTSLSEDQVSNLKQEIEHKNFIQSLSFISKEGAAKIFIQQTGQDFRKILDYNPLPASFTLTLKDDYVEKDSLNKIIKKLAGLSGVDEVVFRHEFTYKILSYISKVKTYIFGATIILFLISLYIVYSTIKLITNSKYEELETMKLVGAKLSTIKMPIILNSIFVGLLAGFFVALGFFLIYFYSKNNAYFALLFSSKDLIYLAGILIIGPFIGLMISLVSLRKINLKI